MRHSGRGGRLPDPSWKSGPPEPKHSHSDHDLPMEPSGWDIDGPGTNEMEKADGKALFVVMEARYCRRDGCDAEETRRHVFTWAEVSTESTDSVDPERGEASEVSDECMAAIKEATPGGFDELVPYAVEHASVTGADGYQPHVTIEVDGEQFGGIAPQFTDVDGPYGTCHGRPHPPDPDPYEL